MAERKQLVLDANSLIRASLGVRLRVLIADCVSEVDFDVAYLFRGRDGSCRTSLLMNP